MMRTDKYPVSPQSPDSAITVQLQLIAVGEKVSERARDVHSTVHPAPELFCMLFCSHFRPFRCFQQFAPQLILRFLGAQGVFAVCTFPHLRNGSGNQMTPPSWNTMSAVRTAFRMPMDSRVTTVIKIILLRDGAASDEVIPNMCSTRR